MITDRPQPDDRSPCPRPGQAGSRHAADGTWELVTVRRRRGLPAGRGRLRAALDEDPRPRVDLGDATASRSRPNDRQLVVQSPGDAVDARQGSRRAGPGVQPGPASRRRRRRRPDPRSAHRTPPTPSPVRPVASPERDARRQRRPARSRSRPASRVVGEAAYSADGQWLAFSARPSRRLRRPRPVPVARRRRRGDEGHLGSTSRRTSRLARRPGAREPRRRPGGARGARAHRASRVDSPSPSPRRARDPDSTPAPATPPGAHRGHPARSFSIPRPACARTSTQPDVWLPVVDPTGRFTVYWSGALLPSADGLTLAARRRASSSSTSGSSGVTARARPAPPTARMPPAAASRGDDHAARPRASAAPAAVFGPTGGQVARRRRHRGRSRPSSTPTDPPGRGVGRRRRRRRGRPAAPRRARPRDRGGRCHVAPPARRPGPPPLLDRPAAGWPGSARAARTARRARSRCWAGRPTTSARSRPSPRRTCSSSADADPTVGGASGASAAPGYPPAGLLPMPYPSARMRPSRTVARAALTAALALGALPGLVGSQEPSPARPIEAAMFRTGQPRDAAR